MQPSELERVQRKHAELEYSIREAEITINSKYAPVINSLQGDKALGVNQQDPKIAQLISLKDRLDTLQELIREDEALNRELNRSQQRIDRWYQAP
mmetsp:Transcript_5133/g.7871  ORF Transcript_5133/g.7871 Transcript_5133/m.7871 type:complete len:95 (+) Transcript_5133:1141-1425(+)